MDPERSRPDIIPLDGAIVPYGSFNAMKYCRNPDNSLDKVWNFDVSLVYKYTVSH